MTRLSAILLVLAACSAPPPPQPVLWAWERPEDLRFLTAGEAEVAVLAGTIRLVGDDAPIHPRAVPLHLQPGATVLAVVRIEAHGGASLSAAQRKLVVDWIIELADRPVYSGLQLDFDAPASARDFYRLLLADLRPRFERLAITALASWCFENNDWLASLGVDEITPMLFRLGPDGGRYLTQLERERGFPNPLCRDSLGVSTDEPLRWRPGARRLYVFHPRPWTATQWRDFASSLR